MSDAINRWVRGDDQPEPVNRGFGVNPKERLEELRTILRAENMSYAELIELQGLAEHIEEGDVELLEAAGVSEFSSEEGS